jgi:polyphosphate kinase 2 (PPK2 family)
MIPLHGGFEKKDAEEKLTEDIGILLSSSMLRRHNIRCHYFSAMDVAGKDGTIKHVTSGLIPGLRSDKL